MGLFFTPVGASVRGKKSNGQTHRSAKELKISDRRLLNCQNCPLNHEPLSHPKMLPTGAEHPVLYFIGEGPGRTEDELGEQFVGESGKLIRGLIPSRWASKIRWNNTVRCRPPKNREPAPLEVECCRKMQVDDIQKSRPQAIVGLGGVVLEWMLGPDRQIGNWRGRKMPVKVGNHVCWFYPIMHPASILRSMNDKKRGEAIERAFERDIARVFSDASNGFPEPLVERDFSRGVRCLTEYGVSGLKQIEEMLSRLRDREHAIDIETNQLRPYNTRAKILSVAIGDYDDVLSFPWEHREAQWTKTEKSQIDEIVRDYLLGSGLKWAHGAKFEQEWFHHRFGPDILYQTSWGDTLGQAHIIDERKGKSLDELTQIHFGFRIKTLSQVDVRSLENTPLSQVLPYGGMDAKYCFALSVVQSDILQSLGLTNVYAERNAATPALVRMQAKGVLPDVSAATTLNKTLDRETERIKHQIMSNRDVEQFRKNCSKFNPSSNTDLVSFFRDHLKIEQLNGRSDTYSVDERALSKIKHPVAKAVLNLRTTTKNNSTYVVPLLPGGKHVHDDGLIHSSSSQYITVSGRLNAEDPNLQNYPRREHKEVRRVIAAPKGHKFVAFDYGQLEWRIGACLSRDQIMCLEIEMGKDIHGDWTDMLGGRFVPKLVKENRKKVRDTIKQLWTFANLYGNSCEAIARDLSTAFGVTVSTTALDPIYSDFWARYHKLHEYQSKLVDQYWATGYVETGTGQRRHEPMARNEIINHPFQGTAGHLVIDAQRRLSLSAYEQDLPALQPIMNVHDDLSFYLPKDGLEDYIETIAKHMCCCPFDFAIVPFSVEVSIGDNWCDKEEIATFTTKDFQ